MDNHLNTPDFEKMDSISDEIHSLQQKKLLLEVEISEVEADTVMELRTNEKYFIKGKPPAMNFIKETYMFSGLSGELIEKRADTGETDRIQPAEVPVHPRHHAHFPLS